MWEGFFFLEGLGLGGKYGKEEKFEIFNNLYSEKIGNEFIELWENYM